jgi:hypothetical protein
LRRIALALLLFEACARASPRQPSKYCDRACKSLEWLLHADPCAKERICSDSGGLQCAVLIEGHDANCACSDMTLESPLTARARAGLNIASDGEEQLRMPVSLVWAAGPSGKLEPRRARGPVAEADLVFAFQDNRLSAIKIESIDEVGVAEALRRLNAALQLPGPKCDPQDVGAIPITSTKGRYGAILDSWKNAGGVSSPK